MELIRGLHNLRPHHRGCVMTIGNYDGVHRGHEAVLRHLHARGRELGLPSLAMIFEPLPAEFFAPEAAPPRLSSLREKLQDLRAAGVDRVLCVRFDSRLASMAAEAFVERIMVEGLGARFVVVGDDFRFGRGREGDFTLLQRLGARHGFEVAHLPSFTLGPQRVSSTRIRSALAQGDMRSAAAMLGRPYRVSACVRRGKALGRTLGYPTANLCLSRKVAARFGVYAVMVEGVHDKLRPGLASLGTRPTVNGEGVLLEVNLLDFEGDLYGRRLGVALLEFLRPEERFTSLEALVAEMRRDERRARAFFERFEAGASNALRELALDMQGN